MGSSKLSGPSSTKHKQLLMVVFKFLSVLMPILTSNTHVTVYLDCLKNIRKDPMNYRWKNLLTEDLTESGLYAYHIVIKNYLFRLRVRP